MENNVTNNNDKQTVLWIHGFAGCPNNVHFKERKKSYTEYNWFSIEVDHHAKSSIEKINAYIHSNDVCVVAGTSLGGYYAMCADFKGPKLIVNPVTNPVRGLKQFLGKNTYKPGRPDGQTEFEFTEDMLNEFGELQHDKLYNVLCHYTPHDQLLGDDIKKDYEDMFYFLEMMDEKVLPEHFMTFKYVKAMKEILPRLIWRDCLRTRNPYDWYGSAYQYLPNSIIPVLMIAQSPESCVNRKKLLREIEACIKEEYQKDNKLRYEPWNRNENKTKEILKILLRERKYVLSRMFNLSQETFNAFMQINKNLLDLYNRMVDKMAKLYSGWLEEQEEGWQNDCQIFGQIIVEQSKEDVPADDTGSDYGWMMERIEELDGNHILSREFSGAPDIACDTYQLGLSHDYPNLYFSGGGERPFGDFLMCNPFQNLYSDSLYSPQDILRIKYYWCDTCLTYQRITNEKGELQ